MTLVYRHGRVMEDIRLLQWGPQGFYDGKVRQLEIFIAVALRDLQALVLSQSLYFEQEPGFTHAHRTAQENHSRLTRLRVLEMLRQSGELWLPSE
jgi:hypothetical protein